MTGALAEEPHMTDPHVHGDPASSDARDFKLGGETPQVMRLSRKTLAVLGATASLCIACALIVALTPSSQMTSDNLVDTDGRSRAGALQSAPADYTKIPNLGPPLPGDLGGPILAARNDGRFAPMGPIEQSTEHHASPALPIASEEQALRLTNQEHDTARTSKLFLETQTGDSQVQSAPARDPAATTLAAPLSLSSARKNGAMTSIQRIERAKSPRILEAGSIIPAALITGIRSDLPGKITAQVTQNVYDSPTGRLLLIPQGARLIGEYDSKIEFGQNRVLLVWDRLLLPGGYSLVLDRLPGADASGKMGLSDRTDYHWGRMLKAALISTLLGAGSDIVSNDQSDLVRALRFGTQDMVNQTGRQLVERELKIPPTLTIQPGFNLRILVTQDLIFEPADAK
jgi:type IV secretion system protein VirB10